MGSTGEIFISTIGSSINIMSFEAANDFKYTLAHKHNVLYLTLIEANALPCPISFIKTAVKCLSNIGGTMKFISQTIKNIPAILCYKKKMCQQ